MKAFCRSLPLSANAVISRNAMTDEASAAISGVYGLPRAFANYRRTATINSFAFRCASISATHPRSVAIIK